jgi:hypothetical protein
MSEALNYIIDFSFNELKLDSIEPSRTVKNEHSKKKSGFHFMENRKDQDYPIVFMNM